MSMQRAKALREEAGRLFHEGKAIVEATEKENRDMTAEELHRHKEILDLVESKVDQANTIERAERARVADPQPEPTAPDARTLEIDPDRQQPGQPGQRAQGAGEYGAALRSWILNGDARLTPQQKAALRESMSPRQRAALQVDMDELGGFVSTSETLIGEVLKSLRARLVIMQQARIYTCQYGQTIGQLGMNANIPEIGWDGEIQTKNEVASVSWYKRQLKPKLMRNFTVPVGIYLIRNAMINVEAEVAAEAAEAKAVSLEKAFMLGDGAHKPLGLFVASDEGIPTSRDSATDMTATEFTGDALIEAQDMLDEFHQPNASWLFHRKALTQIRKLKNTVNGDYIWQPGLRAGEPNTILGKPYNTGTYVPSTFTANLYAGMYGDMSQYVIAASTDNEIVRLDQEPYASANQIGLLFRNAAYDGMPRRADAFVRIKMGA